MVDSWRSQQTQSSKVTLRRENLSEEAYGSSQGKARKLYVCWVCVQNEKKKLPEAFQIIIWSCKGKENQII
jgi:hypothetical protein